MPHQDSTLTRWAVIYGMTLFAPGCSDSETPPTTPDAGPSQTGAHWTYEGADGPAHWSDLSQDYAACNSAKKQSPIDIPVSIKPGHLEGLQFSYSASLATIVDTGHTIQVVPIGGLNKLHVDGKDFGLAQFHFHAHSEHTLAGEDYPLELHLVHKAADGALAVVGILFKLGAENAALAPVFAKIASATQTASALAGTLDLPAILPKDDSGWAYSGSLTTPPCTEGVKWHVYSTVEEASTEQIAAFTAKYADDYRPDQPLYGRIISSGNLPHWEYTGAEGPDDWGMLSDSTSVCGSGTQQSPIDLPGSVVPAPLTGIRWSYASAPAAIFDNGHTVQVNFTGGSNKITEGGKDYSLLQFHFHKHSEHTVAGVSHPLELHLVHRASDGALAVVGVFYDMGAANVPLAGVFSKMAEANDVPQALNAEIDPSALIPAVHDGWAYSGSLTTPPCSEGVAWHVMSTPLTVDATQLAAFAHDPSCRPTLPLGNRTLSGGN